MSSADSFERPPDDAQGGTCKPCVIITGSSGKLGEATVALFTAKGWEVVNFHSGLPSSDFLEDVTPGLAGEYRIDFCNIHSVVEACRKVEQAYSGIDAIVHLATMTEDRSLRASSLISNVSSTYNILEAARRLTRKTNVVLAYSECSMSSSTDPSPPSKLPITEEERRADGPDSLSKRLGEAMAEEYARWDPEAKVISLYFSKVMLVQDYKSFETWQDKPKMQSSRLWSYTDARDGAHAIEMAVNSPLKGSHTYLIANNKTCMRTANVELIKAVYPNVLYAPTTHPNETLIDTSRAKKELGFKPQHDWE